MPATLQESLQTLAGQCSIAQTGSDPANGVFAFKLNAPLDRRGVLNVTELLTTTQVADAPIDLGWRAKNVRFEDLPITDGALEGGMPISDLLALNIENTMLGSKTPPGVPGVIGMIAGTVPVPVETIEEKVHQVTIRIQWLVEDAQGNVIGDVQWKVGTGGPGREGNGGDVAPSPADSLEVFEITMASLFVELTTSIQTPQARRIRARVQLIAGGASSGWIDLPPLPLPPVIPVPTILVLFRHVDFKGEALMVVPKSSPINDEGDALATLNTLRDRLALFTSLIGPAVFLLTDLQGGGVVDDIQSVKVIFRKENSIGNLDKIDLKKGFLNNTEAEDELSSLILIGPPSRQGRFYNARNFSSSEGQMNVTVGSELLVRVRSLHSANPASDPAGRVTVVEGPSGTRWFFHGIDSFGDEFSSLKFGWSS